jgi:DNA-binding SARP family transcriptional activator
MALGIVARLEGRFAAAETTLSAALDTYNAAGDQRGMAAVMSELGQLAALRSERDASRLLLREALGLARRAGDEQRAARVLVLTGDQASREGDLVTARSFYDAAADAYERTGDRRGMATVFTALGKLAQLADDLDGSRDQHERALGIYKELSDPRGAALAYSNLGFVAYLIGDHERAEECFKESVDLRRQLGDRRGLAIALVGLANAWFLRDQPDPAGAYRLCEEALAIQREIGDDQNAGWTSYIMAEVARDLRQFDAAAEHAHACIDLYHRAGSDRLAGVGYFSLAALYRHTGRSAAGVAFALEALERAVALGGTLQIVRCVELGSSLCCGLKRFEAGAELSGAAEAARLRAGLRPKARTPEKRLLAEELAAMKAALGDDGFEAASRRGSNWSLDEAVEATRRHLLALGPNAAAVASAGSPEFTVNVLGRFEVFPGPAGHAPAGAATQVVKILAANGSMHLDQLVELLWPDAPPGVGRRRLHNVLSRVRKIFGDLVVRNGQTLTLNLGVNLDAAAFESTARSALALADSGGPAGLLLGNALELYRGELLPDDRFEEWAVVPRERLRQLALRCIGAAARLAESEDDVIAAIGWLERAIELSPLDESPYIEAARLLIRAGRRGRAREMIAAARRVAEDLGVPPSPELAAVEAELAL